MKVKTLIDSISKASSNISFVLEVIQKLPNSTYQIKESLLDNTYDEMALHFAIIEPVMEKYGKKIITYGVNNELTDIFRATLAVYTKDQSRIAEICLAELRMLKGKILAMYNNDMEAEIDLSE
jgi:hypothetical protein